LISNLGGALGLFTGMAIIMIFEGFELTFDLVYNIWKYLNPRLERKRRESANLG
jgi:hypothetical protein